MNRWWSYLAVGVLLVGGLMVSIQYSPVWYDDSGHFLVAREVSRSHGMCYPVDSEGTMCIADSPFITMGPVQTYPLGAWLGLFGETMLLGRVFMAALALLACAGFYFLGRRLTNPGKALIAVGIMALNIQFLTYGAEVLGEVPMMGLVLAGLGLWLGWMRGGPWWHAAMGLVCWCLAVGVKEYAVLPTTLALVFGVLHGLFPRDAALPPPVRSRALTVAGLGSYALGLLGMLALLHGWDLPGYFRSRQSYGSEFLALNLAVSLRFLAFKPLFWMGTGAMLLKWRVKRRMEEAMALSFQAAWLLFFLLSAGYDRFGFLLLFLPAIYVAEYVPFLWKQAGRKEKGAWLRRTVLVAVAFVLFSQQTWWVFAKRIGDPASVNAIERKAAEQVSRWRPEVVVTADQQVALFLEEVRQPYRLVHLVPSQARMQTGPHPECIIREGEVLLAGPYAFTEYARSIDWQGLEALDSVAAGAEKWVTYRMNGCQPGAGE